MALVWLATALIVGIWAGNWIEMPWQVFLLVAGLALTCAYFFHDRRRFVLLLTAMVAIGVARAANSSRPPSPNRLAFYAGTTVDMHGVVDAEPDIRDTGSNYVVSAGSVLVHGTHVPISGSLHVHTARSTQLEYGDSVEVRGYLRAPPRPLRLGGRAIQAEMAFPRVVDLGPSATGIRGWVFAFRRRMENGIDAWLPEPEAALLIAITLGSRSSALGDLSPVLVSTGLIHVIAISGIKVALVAGTLYHLVKQLGRRTPALVVSLAALLVYVLLTGATASGERSALMWAMVFFSVFLGRGTVALVSLAVVAAAMLAFDPTLLWDTGFLMSTTGTLAIVAFSAPLIRRLRFVPSPWREALCVSAAAQVGTLPIVIVGFQTVAVISPLSNACVLPLLPALIAVGFALGALSVFPAIASPLAAFAYVLLHAFVIVAEWFSNWSAQISATSMPIQWSVAYYVILGGAAAWVLRQEGWVPTGEWSGHGREVSLALICGLSTMSVSGIGSALPSVAAHLTWLGAGQAVLLTTPDESVLIDGSSTPYALLEQLGKVLPSEVHTINLVVVTDSRSSNVAGLQSVLQHYRVQEVMDVGAQYPSETYALWRDQIFRKGIATYAVRTGSRMLVPGATITVLGPDTVTGSAKDCVGLLRLELQRRSYLFIGASSVREQRSALFRGQYLRSDVLVSPAGSDIDPQFFRAVSPRAVVAPRVTHTGVPTVKLTPGTLVRLDLVAIKLGSP